MAEIKNYRAPEMIARWRTLALGAGAIGMILLAVGTYFNVEQGLRSWLLGFIFWSGMSIGALGLLMLQYLTGGAWGVVIRRALEAAVATLPIAVLFFIPLAIGVWTRSVYDWTHLPATDPVMIQRGLYMTPWAWVARGFIYFALFFLIGWILNSFSRSQDESTTFERSARLLEKASRFSGPALVAFSVIVSLAAVDWVLTMIPHWFSTIWGLLYLVNWALSSLCFMVALMASLSDTPPMDRVLGRRHFHDLGKLMLALVMVWAYFNFSQYLIIWSGNIPEETAYFIPRTTGGWGWIGAILIFFHFAFPFLVLLQQDFKRRAKWLAWVAVFVLVMRLFDVIWQIGPALRIDPRGLAPGAFYISWMDIVAPVALGGIWLWYFFGRLVQHPLVPVNDPYLQEAIEHGHGH